MLKHIVMFNLKDEAENAKKVENVQKIKEILESLPAKINQIKLYEIGVNTSNSSSAADLVLISGFDSLTTLSVYREHPEHQKALKFIIKVIEELRVVDYEV